MALTHLLDIVTSTASRVLAQYREKPRFMALLQVFTEEVQEVEDGLWGMVAKLNLSTADGTWLEWWGAIVGEARQGESDDTFYRQAIRARVLANRSNGTVDEVIAMLRKLLAAYAVIDPIVTEWPPAAFDLEFPDTVDTAPFAFTGEDDPRLLRTVALLRSTRAAGVGLTFRFTVDAWADTFTWADADALQVDTARGWGDDTNPAVGGTWQGTARA